jgi:hypothetical protein
VVVQRRMLLCHGGLAPPAPPHDAADEQDEE